MTTDEKLDLFKLHKAEYAATAKPALVEVGAATYLTVPGRGAPGGEAFTTAIMALYGIAYTVKFSRKFAGETDYVVGKLEAEWWCDTEESLQNVPPERWEWRLLIRTPEFVRATELRQAVKTLRERGKTEPFETVRLERLTEGRCVQMLHVGPYDRESESIALMAAFAERQGLVLHGRHHEIYLSDPRRIPPERLRTILRRPVKKAAP